MIKLREVKLEELKKDDFVIEQTFNSKAKVNEILMQVSCIEKDRVYFVNPVLESKKKYSEYGYVLVNENWKSKWYLLETK